jgi:hypothetical protein
MDGSSIRERAIERNSTPERILTMEAETLVGDAKALGKKTFCTLLISILVVNQRQIIWFGESN